MTEEEFDLRTERRFKQRRESVYRAVKKYNRQHQNRRLYWSAKQRAQRDGIVFDLEQDDIVIPERCIYLNVPLTNTYGRGRIWTNASIDRVDSTKGYTKENIQIISDLANRMKSNATVEQLVEFATNVLKVHGGSN